MLNTVKVPEQFEPIFEKAQEYVGRYFREKKEDPSKGTIEIFGERYILVRAASMSVEFFETIAKLYEKEGEEEAQNIARQLLFDIAHAIGKQDARNFHKKMELNDPVEKLSAGPVHFSHSGWAFVDIFPESRPSPDENFYLIYDHPYAFESAAWLASGKKSDFPVCVMNAGYSSGWCEESFGIVLVASEIMCQAKGDDACRFIMAPPSKIEGHIADYIKTKPELAKRITKYEVPGFFKRKDMEEALRKSSAELSLFRKLVDKSNDAVEVIAPISLRILDVNETACLDLGYSREELLSMSIFDIDTVDPDTAKVIGEQIQKSGTSRFEGIHRRKDGSTFPVEISSSLVNLDKPYVLNTVRDITERKRAEEALKKANKELLEKSLRLEGFQKMTLGREQRIMELKGEVNELLERLGEAKRYEQSK